MTTEMLTAVVPSCLSWMVVSFADADVSDDDHDAGYLEAHRVANGAAVVAGKPVTLTMSAEAWVFMVDEFDALATSGDPTANNGQRKKRTCQNAIDALVETLGIERM